MGQEIVRALAEAGCKVIMTSEHKSRLYAAADKIRAVSNLIEVIPADLSLMAETNRFADNILASGEPITFIMNNAGAMPPKPTVTNEGFEYTVAVNYLSPYLLTRKLLPLMSAGSRIVSMTSCTHRIGKIKSNFFTGGGRYRRICVYSNTKYALTLFTVKLAALLKDKNISVNAADPWIVSTDMIRMDAWFDKLTDIFFRPFIYTPKQGAATAIHLLLAKDIAHTGCIFADGKRKDTGKRYINNPDVQKLWDDTETVLKAKTGIALPAIE